jgi:hypothetical protein
MDHPIAIHLAKVKRRQLHLLDQGTEVKIAILQLPAEFLKVQTPLLPRHPQSIYCLQLSHRRKRKVEAVGPSLVL